ncbi:hypothetical protein FNAPI_11531 [Fusarium napiforme]|uniref:Uncharacterized protein n=1 Tax=Fusarium napiforme TaxID=42672 RepID=A0A8H5MPU4_9HYPO|nr:hypothetical protein FNAPI_11531 [Fusarium napiforme]
MSNARDKRSPLPHDDEPGRKRGRPTKDELDSLAAEESVSRVQTRLMLNRRPEIQYTRQQESSFYHDLMPWPETYEWSDEDEAAVAEEWQQSRIKEASRDLNTPQYNALFLLFKISLRLYRIVPTVLLSPVTGMGYKSVYFGSNEWIMSKKFCETLSKIMVHPCWDSDIDMLTLALRWAVICRLDSRLKWFVRLPPFSCPVIQKALGNIEGFEGTSLDTSYHEMHKAERERASGRGESLSILSDILYQLGEEASKEPTSPGEKPEYGTLFGRRVLPVTQWDLDVIVKVVNDMNFEPQWNYSVEDAVAAWKAAKRVEGTELPSRDRLSNIYRLSHESIFKWLRLFARQQTTVQRIGEVDDIGSSDALSGDNAPQQTAPSPPHQTRRRTAVDGSSDVRSGSGSEDAGPLQVHHRHDYEEEDSTTMCPEDYELSFHTRDEDGDHGMTDNLSGASFDSGDFPPQATNESDRLRPHGTMSTAVFPSSLPCLPNIRIAKSLATCEFREFAVRCRFDHS